MEGEHGALGMGQTGVAAMRRCYWCQKRLRRWERLLVPKTIKIQFLEISVPNGVAFMPQRLYMGLGTNLWDLCEV